MIQCLAREDMLAHLSEAVSYHVKGDRYAALFHSRITMDLASQLKDAATHKVAMQYRKLMRKEPICAN
ncbi:MAG: hypothetical protein EOS58_31710 [Mesorhizobium sp.]|nr:MAG: hypothetical protein EOS58_31710 [Mesorhizobium sp.]